MVIGNCYLLTLMNKNKDTIVVKCVKEAEQENNKGFVFYRYDRDYTVTYWNNHILLLKAVNLGPETEQIKVLYGSKA